MDGRMKLTAGWGAVCVIVGFLVDRLSGWLSWGVLDDIGAFRGVKPYAQQALGDLGLALMLFGFGLILVVVHIVLSSPRKTEPPAEGSDNPTA